jgi:hypothetical protein
MLQKGTGFYLGYMWRADYEKPVRTGHKQGEMWLIPGHETEKQNSCVT